MCSTQYVDSLSCGMNQVERLYLLKAELARSMGVDPRSKEVKAIEPSAYLVGTRNRRLALYSASLAESLKSAQQREEE
jgi:hypothetical protein